jgi:hypothetical protein
LITGYVDFVTTLTARSEPYLTNSSAMFFFKGRIGPYGEPGKAGKNGPRGPPGYPGYIASIVSDYYLNDILTYIITNFALTHVF